MIIHLALTATFFLFCLAVIYGAICDVRTYTIPNRVPYGLAGLFVVFATLVWLNTPYMPHIGFHMPPILFNVAYGFAVFVFFVVFWKLGWVGGGDAKFVSAISLFMGREHVLPFVILLTIFSLVFFMVLKFLQIMNPLFLGDKLPEFVKNMLLKAEERAIPYGLPAAMSALIMMPNVMAKVY
jgi:prepilin peptidase CpaA